MPATDNRIEDIPSPLPDPAALRSLVDHYPAPAVLVSNEGRIAAVNDPGRPLAALLHGGRGSLPKLLDLVRRRCRSAAAECRFEHEGTVRTLDVTMVPGADGSVLCLARDMSLEHNLLGTLVNDRQQLRDIVACAGDFAWETDREGGFTFAEPAGLLGFAAAELTGRKASALIDQDWSPGRPDPFLGAAPAADQELWLTAKDGTRVCARVSSRLVLDGEGRHVATRGICRDVTAARSRETALAQALDRERLRSLVIEAMRGRGGPARAVKVAAEAAMAALGAQGVYVLRRSTAGPPTVTLRLGTTADRIAQQLETAFLEIAAAPPGAPCPDRRGREDGLLLLAAARESGMVVGLLALARRDDGAWPAGHGALLDAVADQLGLALGLIERMDMLERLSRIDGLTGLLNRRAFTEEMPRKLRHGDRLGRGGSVLLLDLDNFKPLNDRFGHAFGDHALAEIGRELRDHSRAGDLAARLGGDEFALWLDGAETPGALVKAEALIAATRRISSELGGEALGLSIGIASYRAASREPYHRLLARADAALYRAKLGGRGQAQLADAPG